MQFTKEEKLAISALIIGLLGMVCLFVFGLSNAEKTTLNFLSLFGTLLSIVGIWIAYLQIRNLQTTTSAAKNAAETALKKLNQFISISELSNGYKLCQEIQQSIRYGKHEVALIRMQDLQQVLTEQYDVGILKNLIRKKTFTILSTNLRVDIDNINSAFISKTEEKIDYAVVLRHLNEISSELLKIKSQLKNNSYDT